MKSLYFLISLALLTSTITSLTFELTSETQQCFYEDIYFQNVSIKVLSLTIPTTSIKHT